MLWLWLKLSERLNIWTFIALWFRHSWRGRMSSVCRRCILFIAHYRSGRPVAASMKRPELRKCCLPTRRGKVTILRISSWGKQNETGNQHLGREQCLLTFLNLPASRELYYHIAVFADQVWILDGSTDVFWNRSMQQEILKFIFVVELR